MNLSKFPTIKVLIVLVTVFLINGCSLFAPRVQLHNVRIDVEPRANNDTPLALDFVTASDALMLDRLKATTASQWFEQREQLQRDYPGAVHIWSLEVVPGQLLNLTDNPLHRRKAQGLLIFARYSTPGPHRLLLQGQDSIWLKVGAREMRLLDAKGQ